MTDNPMKDLRPIKGRYYIQRLISEGEHEQQDFKFAISDARKIARSISAFANCHGGRLLIGVKDNGAIAGVRNDEDLYVIDEAAQLRCVPPQPIEFKAYRTDPGVMVYVARIAPAIRRPVYVDEGGDAGLTAYLRVADENIVAHPLQVRAWESSDREDLAPLNTPLSSAILQLVDSAAISPDRIAYQLHVTREAADATVARLLGAGLLTILHTKHGFVLTTPVKP